MRDNNRLCAFAAFVVGGACCILNSGCHAFYLVKVRFPPGWAQRVVEFAPAFTVAQKTPFGNVLALKIVIGLDNPLIRMCFQTQQLGDWRGRFAGAQQG